MGCAHGNTVNDCPACEVELAIMYDETDENLKQIALRLADECMRLRAEVAALRAAGAEP